MCDRGAARAGAGRSCPDARLDPRFADNPFVTGVIGDVRFYAAHQLVTPEGVVDRHALRLRRPSRGSSTSDQARALRTLADRVVDVLELELRTRQLGATLDRAGAARAPSCERSNEQLAAFAGQVSHDLRNPLTAVSMSLRLIGEQRRRSGGPTTDAALAGRPGASAARTGCRR